MNLLMIDMGIVLLNVLWILGLSLALATWSMASYRGHQEDVLVSEILRRRSYAWCMALGGLLFCLGLAATESRTWARLVWIGMGAAFIVGRVWDERDAKD